MWLGSFFFFFGGTERSGSGGQDRGEQERLDRASVTSCLPGWCQRTPWNFLCVPLGSILPWSPTSQEKTADSPGQLQVKGCLLGQDQDTVDSGYNLPQEWTRLRMKPGTFPPSRPKHFLWSLQTQQCLSSRARRLCWGWWFWMNSCFTSQEKSLSLLCRWPWQGESKGDSAFCFLGDTGLATLHGTSLSIWEGSGHLDTAGHLEILKWIVYAKSLSLCRLTWSWVLGSLGISGGVRYPAYHTECVWTQSVQVERISLSLRRFAPVYTPAGRARGFLFSHTPIFLPFKPSGFPTKNCAQSHGPTPWILNWTQIYHCPPAKKKWHQK